MRILFVVPSINPHTGGPAQSNLRRAAEVARLGHSVELYSTKWPAVGTAREKVFTDGVTVTTFPPNALPGLSHVPYSSELVRAVRRNICHFDVCHACSLWNPLISRTMGILRQRRIPYALTTHGMLDPVVLGRNRAFKWLWAAVWERENVESADLIHFTSEAEHAKACALGWRFRRTVVVPNPVDIDVSTQLPPRSAFERDFPCLIGKEVVLFVGRINWVKNLDQLVTAIARVHQAAKDVVLVCVGPDNEGYRSQLERQAERLGIRESVVFTGFLEGERLRDAYARADTVALVSRKENFGLAAADALAYGVPVVLSDGVDMGKEWPAPPVWRTAQDAASIARALDASLSHARTRGLPCLVARNLAEREWGVPHERTLVEAYEAISAERMGRSVATDARRTGTR